MEPYKINNQNKMKMIDRIIKAYQAKKLMLQAQEIQSNVKEEKVDTRSRMDKAYRRNKRQKKIDKLLARLNHWRNLS